MRNRSATSTFLRNRIYAWFATTTLMMLVIVLASTAAFADPPARVGRIGFIEGDVSFYADRSEGWQKARLNFPVTNKNSIWTNGPGRAEVRIGASALRIESNTILDFARLDDNGTRAFLQRGILNVRLRTYSGQDGNVRDDYRDGFRIETDAGVAVLEANGRYRIDAGSDARDTRISVFVGRIRFEQAGNALFVEPGKTLIARYGDGGSSYFFASANESEFDRWAEARDVRWDESHSRAVRERVVSARMTGYEDLDQYGDWVDDGEYGRIWAPRVVVTGWAPYRYGSWSYVRPWGWTWVDDAPWGFAPFHYGRWVLRGARWCWWPGAYSYRPVYAPALVGWVGRPGWNVSISVGSSVGWFPLAPREHFIPGYTNNVTYIRQINNVTNNITINNPPPNYTYANQLPGATIVQSNVMLNGESVWRNANNSARNNQALNQPPVVSGSSAVPPGAPAAVRKPMRLEDSTAGLQPTMTPPPMPSLAAARTPRLNGEPAGRSTNVVSTGAPVTPQPVFDGAGSRDAPRLSGAPAVAPTNIAPVSKPARLDQPANTVQAPPAASTSSAPRLGGAPATPAPAAAPSATANIAPQMPQSSPQNQDRRVRSDEEREARRAARDERRYQQQSNRPIAGPEFSGGSGSPQFSQPSSRPNHGAAPSVGGAPAGQVTRQQRVDSAPSQPAPAPHAVAKPKPMHAQDHGQKPQSNRHDGVRSHKE